MSTSARAAEFELLALTLVSNSAKGKVLLPSTTVHAVKPGQWDGLVRYRSKTLLLEAKAYTKRMPTVPLMHKRLEEARAAGIDGVLLVTLSGLSRTLFDNLPKSVTHLKLSELLPQLPANSVLLPTGDALEFTDKGAKVAQGAVMFGALPLSDGPEGVLAVADDHYRALKRAAMYSRTGAEVALEEVAPFSHGEDEPSKLWRMEDQLRGLYSPPRWQLEKILGREQLDFEDIPSRLAGNLIKVLSHDGTRELPSSRAECSNRVSSYEPFVFFASHRRRSSTMAQCISRIASAYSAYEPYARNLFNANKCRAIARYLEVSGAKV
ncbi:MAG: hypothetical protein U5N86_05905 [Planctomycetota bacterium]|nr:hypothetical protein [Planctomycetota bacterium]